jgi:hypothetical protein
MVNGVPQRTKQKKNKIKIKTLTLKKPEYSLTGFCKEKKKWLVALLEN